MKNKVCIKAIEFYQTHKISNNKHCRFYPTCSCYSKEAFEKYNFFKAFFLTIGRILRCNPLCKGGYDPVPETKPKFIKLTNDIYYLESRKNTDYPVLGYVLGTNYSVMLDGGASSKHNKMFYRYLQKNKLKKPSVTLITHHHWDHLWGANTNTFIMASSKCKEHALRQSKLNFTKKEYEKNFRDDEIPYFCIDHIRYEYKNTSKIKVPNIDQAIDKRTTLDIGNEQIEIIPIKSYHTDDSLIFLMKKNKVLFIGDCTCGRIVGVDFEKNKEIIEYQIEFFKSLDFNICLDGHSNPLTKEELISDLKNDLTEILE